MLRVLRLCLLAASIALAASSPRAAHDFETAALPRSNLELLVVEVEGCIYCLVFRRDVLPNYQQSAQARSVPMRFIDLNEAEEQKVRLSEPVTQVPTILLMKEGQELGRISGYLGPENFYHAINRLISGTP